MEDYAAKMVLKSDAALREYVTGYVQYRDAAVLAALAELRRRGQPAPEEEGLRPLLEAGAVRQQELDAAAEAALAQEAALKERGDDEEEVTTGPSLYSRGTIVLFSLLSTLAGAILLSINLARLGKWRAVLGVFLFLSAYSFLLNLTAYFLKINIFLLAPLLNLPVILVYLLFFWPRYIGDKNYQSRSWLVPAIICVLLFIGIQQWAERHPKEVRKMLEKMMPK
jgi:hypothetical protein